MSTASCKTICTWFTAGEERSTQQDCFKVSGTLLPLVDLPQLLPTHYQMQRTVLQKRSHKLYYTYPMVWHVGHLLEVFLLRLWYFFLVCISTFVCELAQETWAKASLCYSLGAWFITSTTPTHYNGQASLTSKCSSWIKTASSTRNAVNKVRNGPASVDQASQDSHHVQGIF